MGRADSVVTGSDNDGVYQEAGKDLVLCVDSMLRGKDVLMELV